MHHGFHLLFARNHPMTFPEFSDLVARGIPPPADLKLLHALWADDPVELRIYRGADGQFDFYEDANDGYGYERGEYSIIPITWDDTNGQLTIGERRGGFPRMTTNRTFAIVLARDNHGVGVGPTTAPDRVIQYNGSMVSVAP